MERETNYGGSPPRSLLIPPCCGIATVAIAVAPLAAVFVAPYLISSLGAGWRVLPAPSVGGKGEGE